MMTAVYSVLSVLDAHALVELLNSTQPGNVYDALATLDVPVLRVERNHCGPTIYIPGWHIMLRKDDTRTLNGTLYERSLGCVRTEYVLY